MTKETYLDHLNDRIAEIDHKIAEARDYLENGKPTERVVAAGELTLLDADRSKFADRLEKARDRHAHEWSTLNTTFHEDLDALSDAIEAWIVKHRAIKSPS